VHQKLDKPALTQALTRTVLEHTAAMRTQPDIDTLIILFVKAARAAFKQRESMQDVMSLETMPFTQFYNLTIPVPQKTSNSTIDYPLLSEYFRNEPFFKEYPNVAAVRQVLADENIQIDGLTGIRYDRRAELAQLVYRCGLEPLSGMPEWMPECTDHAIEYDHKYLRRIMDLTMSPQARSAITSFLARTLNDDQYHFHHPISRTLIRAHLLASRSDHILGEMLDQRNFSKQAAAHVVFLLYFQEIGLDANGVPMMKPRKPTVAARLSRALDNDLKS
jgi:hypothetical protein